MMCAHLVSFAEAVDDLHWMFMEATKHVLATPELWPCFGFPPGFWAKAEKSLADSPHLIAGRFDFAITPNGKLAT